MSDKQVKPSTQNTKNASTRFPFYVSVAFSFIALCTAVAGVAFSVWTWQKDNATAIRYRAALQPIVGQVQDEKQLVSGVQQELALMRNNLQKLAAKASRQDRKWVLAEVEYLLRVADYNLQFQGNVAATIVLLSNADDRIKMLPDPRYLDLRKLLAEKISALKGVSKIDIAGLLVQLDALAKQLSKLPLLMPADKKITVQKTPEDSTVKNEKWWKRSMHRTWGSLQKVVVIRHHHQSVQPLIAPDQHQFLEENLQTKLMQAQWAVLYKNPKVYRHSLQQVKAWVAQYYKVDASPTKAILDSLDNILQINVKPTQPSLTELLDKLDALKIKASGVEEAQGVPAKPEKPAKLKPMSVTSEPAKSPISKKEKAVEQTVSSQTQVNAQQPQSKKTEVHA